MYQLKTKLKHFRFNSIHQHGPFSVTWFKLSEHEEEGICFSMEELKALTEYMANNKTNFDNQNYFSCDPDETTACGEYDILPLPIGSFPTNLILRKIPRMKNIYGNIYTCMDIELLNENGTVNKSYNLSFDVIGRIELNYG